MLKSEGDDMLLPELPAHRQSHFGELCTSETPAPSLKAPIQAATRYFITVLLAKRAF